MSTSGVEFDTQTDQYPDEGVPSSPDEIRRLPHEVVRSFIEHAEDYLSIGPAKQFVLAFMAGSFIAFGAMLSGRDSGASGS